MAVMSSEETLESSMLILALRRGRRREMKIARDRSKSQLSVVFTGSAHIR